MKAGTPALSGHHRPFYLGELHEENPHQSFLLQIDPKLYRTQKMEATAIPFQTEPDAAPARLIVRRVKPTPGSQLALFANYRYHGFITDRDGETLELEADHRRHAEIENAIRDLKYGVGLNHLPSGRFAANAAWLAVQVIAHNPGSFSFQGLAKPRMAKAWPGVQPMRRIAAAMLVSPPLRSSPKTTLRNAAIT